MRKLDDAAEKIEAFLAGDRDVRLFENEEGARGRLFHQINALMAVSNAQVERERQGREFLKDTIADISHQLKTPLTSLSVYNGILAEAAGDVTTVRKFTALTEQELDRIASLTDNLLKLAKLDAGAVVLQKREENIADLMESVRGQFSFRAEREGKTLLFSGVEGLVFPCDGMWLAEAVGNLVKNALDHTESGGRISVSWEKTPIFLQITVSDDGSGIYPEDLHHIFKRFYRSRFSKDTKGVGLGLPLAKAVIEAHGGTIETESEVGRSSTFFVNLPFPTDL